jgi:hypothetical protein
VTHYPDTGLLLDGHSLPGLREGITLACKFHEDLGGLHTIGWDLALTPTGPLIVEANSHWDSVRAYSVSNPAADLNHRSGTLNRTA